MVQKGKENAGKAELVENKKKREEISLSNEELDECYGEWWFVVISMYNVKG